MTSPILLIAGRFLLASALLMALYWVVWRKQATYRAKRTYLLTMPAVALAIALLQVEVYKPEPVVVEITTELSGPSPSGLSPSGPSPIPSQGRGVDTTPVINQLIEDEASSATLSEGQSIPLPPLGEGKGWGPWSPWGFGLLYSLIVLMLCIPFVVNVAMVRRLRRGAHEERDKANDICILTGEDVKAPFSFHRTIFLPQCLTEAQRRMILAHERGHILHRHYIDVWVAEAVTRLLWFNPFLWWARAELRNVHEFEADCDVLGTGEDVYAYQTILIEEVLHGDVVIANGFNHSFIRRRFIEMLQSTNHRMTSLGKAGTTAWMMLVIALMCCTVGEAETIYKEVETLSDISQGEVAESPQPVIIIEHTERKGNTTGSDTPLPTFEEKRDSLLWAHANSVPTDFKISIRMKSKEEQKLFERFMGNWLTIVDHNGWLERGEIPTHESLTEEEERNCIVKAREHFRKKLTQTLSQIDAPLRDTLNQFLEKFGLDFVLPKGKGFMVVYKQGNGEPKFWGRPEQKKETVPDLSSDELSHISMDLKRFTEEASEAQGVMANTLGELFKSLFGSLTGSLTPMTQETYDSLKSLLPADEEVASLEEINKGLALLRDSLQMVMNTLYPRLKPDEVVDVPMTTFTTGINIEETEEINRIAKIANEPAITNDASLREQDEALQAFFKGWFDMNKSSQEPMLTEEEFQQALKTEPIPPGFAPTYKAYKERTKNFIAEAEKKMEEGHARLNKEIRPQVEAVLKQHGKRFPPERQLKIIIRAAYKNATWEFENSTHPNTYGCAVTKNFKIVDDPSSPDYNDNNDNKNFISPQWGLELPEGYVRLTDYRETAKTDATARKQYDQLMTCYRKAQSIRKELLRDAYKKEAPRYVSVEEVATIQIRNLFRNAGIEMLEKGAYRLPDGTIVMEDDQHNLVPQSVDYQQGTTDRDPRLCNKAPRMERDKSPNYSAHNEQTWPVYTNVQTVPTNEYTPEPQVFRGKNCTYVVEHYKIVYNFHWFFPSSQSKLTDPKTGNQYMVRYTEHFPLDTYMWIHEMEGKVIRRVYVFPPLPKEVTTVDFIPGRIPADDRLSNASPHREHKKLKVQKLDESKSIKVVY